MKLKLTLLTLVGLASLLAMPAITLTGCAKMQNQIAADGGFFGSYRGDYVVRNDSGGRIMDVWVLRNVMVQSDEHGSGWLFQDDQGNVVHLGGDVKVVRVNERDGIGRYYDYHAEFETKTYQELHAGKPTP